MGLITKRQYTESLKDKRIVYYDGVKINDVTSHPSLKVCIDTAAIDYEMAEMPEYRELAVVNHPSTGEPISRYYYTPQNANDLLKRHELMVTATRLGNGVIPFIHDVGADALNAVNIVANQMANKKYMERAEQYRLFLQREDLSVACAMTDVKGDRSLHPASPQQGHQDYYLRIIDKNDEGIVVRGAKAHITAAPYCKELLVLPSRNMTEADKDYAVAFAIPMDTAGVVQICHPVTTSLSSSDFPLPASLHNHTDSLIVFNDVFVPWERVFLCGEWQFAMSLVYNFAYIHRHTAASYRIPMTEALIGVSQAMADYNGIAKQPHVIEKITDLVIYVDTLKSMARASCLDFVMYGNIPIPNPIISNIAKYHFATNFHNCVKTVEDIAGGLLITAPTYKDFTNPEISGYIQKYLGGKNGIPAEYRLRMLQLIRLLLGVETETLAVHAEGSLQAQRMTIFAESKRDIAQYKDWVENIAGIRK